MENYLKSLKVAVLLTLFSLSPLVVYSQATANELLDGYVSASVNKENVTPYITKINQVFKNYNKDKQAAFRWKVYERIIGDTIIEQQRIAKKMALIDLYALLADSNDSRLDDLYFQKGEICGLHTGDTIMLKECITGLKLSDQSKTEKVTGYIATLQDYLDQIRNYLPVSKRIDGIWVSDLLDEIHVYPENNYAPLYVLVIENGIIKLDPMGYAYTNGFVKMSENLLKPAWSSSCNIKVKDDKLTYAQSVVDIGNEKIYAIWSSEKLKIPNQAVALSIGQTIGDITTNTIQKETSSLIGDIGGEMLGNIMGNVIGNAIVDVFAPSKKIHVLEMEIERINDYELVAHTLRKLIKIGGDTTAPIIEEHKEDVSFMKYTPKSGVYYGSPAYRPKYIPGNVASNSISSKYNEIVNADNKYKKNIQYGKMRLQTYDYQQLFAKHQYNKLYYYNKQKLLENNTSVSTQYHQKKETYMGIDIELKSQAEKSVLNALRVLHVDEMSPAFLFGIKEGDTIISVDGFEMNNPELFYQYIQSLHPYDWINLHIIQGKKEKDIQVELTWK